MEKNTSDLIELEILSLSPSNKIGFWEKLFYTEREERFCLVLRPVSGSAATIKLPVIIGKHEGMTIAIVLEGMQASMPLTHDLFKNATDAFGYKLDSIVIDNVKEGIFQSMMQFSNGDKKIELSARVSDAVTMALKYKAPIYVLHTILKNVGAALQE